MESSLSRENSESMLWADSVHTPASLASLPPARGHVCLREHWVKNSFVWLLLLPIPKIQSQDVTAALCVN